MQPVKHGYRGTDKKVSEKSCKAHWPPVANMTMDTEKSPTNPAPGPSPETHRAIIVCTDKRGVFFGYVPRDASNEAMLGAGVTVQLKRARMAVHWTNAERGVFGLAAKGPGAGCRIGPPATITVKDVHAVFDVENPDAVARWEAEPWA